MTEQEIVDMLVDARNPQTPSERLNALFQAVASSAMPYEHQLLIFAALARNPNTPPNHLEWLAIGHPEEVVQNPALELLILEDPAFPHADVSVERLAGVPGCPESIRRRSKYSHLGVTLELTSFSADAFSVEYLKDDERNAISQRISKMFLDEEQP